MRVPQTCGLCMSAMEGVRSPGSEFGNKGCQGQASSSLYKSSLEACETDSANVGPFIGPTLGTRANDIFTTPMGLWPVGD